LSPSTLPWQAAYSDQQSSQFQALVDDLLELLDGVIINIDQHIQNTTKEKEDMP